MQATKKPTAATDPEALLRVWSVERKADGTFSFRQSSDDVWARKHRRLMFAKAAWDRFIPHCDEDLRIAKTTINADDLAALDTVSRRELMENQGIELRYARFCRWWFELNGGSPLCERALYPAALAFGAIGASETLADFSWELRQIGRETCSEFAFLRSDIDQDDDGPDVASRAAEHGGVWVMADPRTGERTCWKDYINPSEPATPAWLSSPPPAPVTAPAPPSTADLVECSARAVAIVTKVLEAAEHNIITRQALPVKVFAAAKGVENEVRQCVFQLVRSPGWLEEHGFIVSDGMVSLPAPRP